MKNTRDHTEVDVLKNVLGLTPQVPALCERTEKETASEPIVRRATTSKMQRANNRRSQSWVHNFTRHQAMRSGPGPDQRPKGIRFHSHSASVTIVTTS
jgi:hypothetical protein